MEKQYIWVTPNEERPDQRIKYVSNSFQEFTDFVTSRLNPNAKIRRYITKEGKFCFVHWLESF